MSQSADSSNWEELWPSIWGQVEIVPIGASGSHRIVIDHLLPPSAGTGQSGLRISTKRAARLTSGDFDPDAAEIVHQRMAAKKGRVIVAFDSGSGLVLSALAFHIETTKPVLVKAFAVELQEGRPTIRGLAARRILKAYAHVVSAKLNKTGDVYFGKPKRADEALKAELKALGFQLGRQNMFERAAEYYRQPADQTSEL